MTAEDNVLEIVPGKDERGEHIFAVILKRSYQIVERSALKRCVPDHPLRQTDAYYDNGDPAWATIQHEFELAPFKLSADVVVIGRAYAPQGLPVPRMNVSVRVAEREKTVTVFGERKCRYRPNMSPLFSEPVPFLDMEIRYEHAYGGRDEKSLPDIPFMYPRNFYGKGIALRNIQDVIEGLPLPNLEDPQDLLTPERVIIGEPERWHLQPLPQGFGWYPRTSYPRSAYVGSYPPFTPVNTVTPEERMGLLPDNHVALARQFKLPALQPRFHNGASLGLTFDTLRGDETITLRGLTPGGLLEFSLPAEKPSITLDTGSGEQKLGEKLDTVVIRPDDLEVDLIWRAAQRYEGYDWLPRMKSLHAEAH